MAPQYPRLRRVKSSTTGTDVLETPYVPELSPVTDRQALLMTRPWLEWCRRVTGLAMEIGVSSVQFSYRFTTVTTAPPNAQQVMFNVGYPYDAVTRLYASNQTDNGADVARYLSRIPVGARIFIQQVNDSTRFLDVEVTSTAIDHGTYTEIPVTFVKQGSGALANNQTVEMAVMSAGGGTGGGGGTGDVVGPSTATNDAIAVYNGTSGKSIKDSLKTIANVISDAVAAAINAILPGGKLPQANLPANVAYTDAANTFSTGPQTLQSVEPRLTLVDTFQPANARQFVASNDGQALRFSARNDAGLVLTEPLTLYRDGSALVGGDLIVTDVMNAAGGLSTTPLNASQLTSGTVPDARLSTNVQMKPIAAAELPNHAGRHYNDGADPVYVTGLAGFPGGNVNFLRADGVFALPPGGAGAGDVIGPDTSFVNDLAVWGDTTGNKLEDSGIQMSNVARRDAANTFTQTQDFTKPYSGLRVSGNLHPGIILNESPAPADAKRWRINAFSQLFKIETLNDAEDAVLSTPLTLYRDGKATIASELTTGGSIFPSYYVYPGAVTGPGKQTSWYLASHSSYGLYTNTGFYFESAIYPHFIEARAHMRCATDVYAGYGFFEYGRGIRLGHWIGASPNYSTDAGYTWNVGNVYTQNYTLIGKTIIFVVTLIAGSLSAACSYLYVDLPGIIYATRCTALCDIDIGGVGHSVANAVTVPGGGRIEVHRVPFTAFPAGGLTLQFTISAQIN